MESQIAPPISGCSVRSPGSRIPKPSSARSKLQNGDTAASPRPSKLATPKTILKPPIRKSVSQPTSVRKPSPKTSCSESAIPKPQAKSSVQKTSDSPKAKRPTRIATPRTLTKLNRPIGGIQNAGLLSVAPELKADDHSKENIFETGLGDQQHEKSLEDISDAIFERVCGSEKVVSVADAKAPLCLTDSDSSESAIENDNKTLDTIEEDSKPPHVPPLDLNLLDDYDALLLYEAMKEEELSITRETDEELERLEEEDSIRLAEEKQQLLDDMQSLKNKLEKQQQESLETQKSDSEKEELETKLKSKQKEVDSVNEKFAELLDEQQKLLTKVSERSDAKKGSSNAVLIAVIVVLIGILIFFWQRG